MLSAQAVAVTAEPDGRSAPEVSLDARVRRCRVGTTGYRGQFRRHTGLIVPFGDGHQGYSTPKSTSASYLSGECRMNSARRSLPFNLTALGLPNWPCGFKRTPSASSARTKGEWIALLRRAPALPPCPGPIERRLVPASMPSYLRDE